MMNRILIFLFSIALFCGCTQEINVTNNDPDSFSDGFKITSFKTYDVLDIYAPWQKASGELFRYIIRDGKTILPDSLQGFPQIIRPVKKVIVLSTTHIGYISALGKQESIVGVSGKDYVYDSIVREGIDRGKVSDIGFIPSIDYEKIIQLQPDVVFLYGLGPSIVGTAKRLAEAGVKSIIIGEYLETHPLGKMEWIKVFASCYNISEVAESLITHSETEYCKWADMASMLHPKPAVIVGLPWKDTWFMAGGKSITSRFIKDAGGNYLWSENTSTEFIPLDLESVFSRAIEGEVWINSGSAKNLDEIVSYDSRFTFLPVFQSGQVYNNNVRLNNFGGNDFWESGVVYPEIILKDLIKIFYPESAIEHDFVYYKKLDHK